MQAEQALNAAALAESNRIAAEQRAEQERVAAAKRQADAVEQAKRAEINRQASEAAEINRQEQERKANADHQTQIFTAAKVAMIEGGISEECAISVIKLIRAGKVPNIKITY